MSHCTTFAEAGRLVDAGRRAPFLLTLCEEDENELHITICCAKAEPNAQTPSTGNAALDDILAHCTPLCPDENAKIELIFENYLLYQVRNESYCVFDADEVRSGTYLCTFERSKLLDYLPRAIDVHLNTRWNGRSRIVEALRHLHAESDHRHRCPVRAHGAHVLLTYTRIYYVNRCSIP